MSPTTPPRMAGPLRRLSRDRPRLIAVILVALVALAASGVQSGAAVALQRTLDANWRGAYDILVTAKAATGGSSTLLPPNALGDGSHGMTLAQLAAVRRVSGVGVAAPIGEAVVSSLATESTGVTIPAAGAIAAGAVQTPQAYQFDATFTTDDGLGPRFVGAGSAQAIIDMRPGRTGQPAQDLSDGPVSYGGVTVDCATYPALCMAPGRPAPNVTTLERSGLGASPVVDGMLEAGVSDNTALTATRITLVDPAAERALLGSKGAFLAPLTAVPMKAPASSKQLLAWADGTDNRYAKCLTALFAPSESASVSSDSGYGFGPDYQHQLEQFLSAHPKANDSGDTGMVPVLVSGGGSATLSVHIDVSSLGAATPAPPSDADPSGYVTPVSSAHKTRIGSIDTDESALLNPFVGSESLLPFPGTDAQPPTRKTCSDVHNLSLASVGVTASSGAHSIGSGDRVVLNASGYANPAAQPTPDGSVSAFGLASDGTAPGFEAAYGSYVGLTEPDGFAAPVAVPIGTFSTKSLAAYERSLDYVPLGAYQSVGSTATVDGSAKQLHPSITGLGLVAPRTIAIASIYDAPSWLQKAPVSAIRVRVAGISGYTSQAEAKVVSVAQAIEALGLHATIVAGSSPSPVTVRVNGYAFGTSDPNGTQRVGTLGDVSQYWSELGAAARTQVSLSGATLAVLGIGLGSAVILLGAVQFASIPRRRAQAAILGEIGWRRRRIRQWMTAEELPALALVVVIAAVSAWLAGFSRIALEAGGVGVAAVLATSVIAVAAGSVRAGVAAPSRRASARRAAPSPRSFGLRQSRIHPLIAVTLIVATLIVSASAGAIVISVFAGYRAAGHSLLAQFSANQALVPQLALGLAGLVSGVFLAVTARRADLRTRAPQWQALRAMGWTRHDLASAQIAESLATIVPAIALTAVLAVAATLLGLGPALPFVGTATGASVVVSLFLIFLGRSARG